MEATPGRPDRADRTDRNDRLARPRFRQDLVAETIDDQGGRFIDVMDPDGGNIFRFYEVEYSLACGMDGERDVAGIVKWAQDELGLTPSQQEVRSVIATLGELGFIDAGEAAAQAAREEPLAPGVVAPAARQAPQAPGAVELGRAGGGPRGEPLPAAPPIQLGAPGAAARRPAGEPAPNVELGAPGARQARPTPRPTPVAVPAATLDDGPDGETEVSIDLSDHIAVRPDDVKEAVRASKVMAAVEAPHGRFDTIDDRPEVIPPPMASRPPEPARPPAAQRSLTRPSIKIDPRIAQGDAMPEAQIEVTHEVSAPRTERTESRVAKAPVARPPDTRTGKPAVELPRPPDRTEKAAVPQAPSARPSPVLLVLLIVVILGGGAFLAWKYVLSSQAPDIGAGTPPVAPPVKPTVPPVAAPPPPAPALASKVVMEPPAPDDVKTARAGQIETILVDKTVVKAGEPIVKLLGVKQVEADLASLTRDQGRIKELLAGATKRRDSAQAAGNKADEAKATAEITERQKVLVAKTDLLASRTVDLTKFTVSASADGVVTRVAKPGQKVAADEVVARLQRDPAPGATFAITDSTSFATNASVDLTVTKTAQRVTCTIADVQPDSIKVACPVDPALTEGTDVTVKLQGASPEAPPPPPSPAAPAPAAPGAPPMPK